MKNITLISEIRENTDFYSGKKTMTELFDDPQYKDILSQEDKEILLEYEEYVKLSKQFKAFALSYGIDLSKVDNYLRLVLTDTLTYMKLVPLLIHWIETHPNHTFEIYIRMLSVPNIKQYVIDLFLKEFARPANDRMEGYKWAVGNGLEIFAADDIVDKLIPLVTNEAYGSSRQMVVRGLGKMKKPESIAKVIPILNNILQNQTPSNQDLTGHAMSALGMLKQKESLAILEPFIASKNTYFRNNAKKAIAKITKALSKK